MENVDLEFLNQIISVATPTVSKAKTTYETSFDADFRVYKNGKLFASEKMISEFELQFTSKRGEPKKGNGVDLIPSESMVNANGLQNKLFIAFTPKVESRIDLFDSCKFDEAGEPTGDVTRGTDLDEDTTKYLFAIFGQEGSEYIEFNLVRESEEILAKNTNNVFVLRKQITRGSRKNEFDNVVREKSRLFLVK